MANATITADLQLYTSSFGDNLIIECELEAQPGDPIAFLKQPLHEIIINRASEEPSEVREWIEGDLAALRKTVSKLEQWLADNPE